MQEEHWVIQRKERETIATRLGKDYFKDPVDLGYPPLGDNVEVDPNLGYSLLRPVRVPVDEENNRDFDKAYVQRRMTLSVQKVIHADLITKMREVGDTVSAAKLLSTPRTPAIMRVIFSGMSMSNFCRLDRQEFIEMLRSKLMVPICEPRRNTARCSCGYEVSNLLSLDSTESDNALSVLTNHVGVCTQVSGRLRHNRHDALKRVMAQLLKDMIGDAVITTEEGIVGYGPHGRMDLMVSIPPAGDVRPIDVGFTAAAQSSMLAEAATDPDAVTKAREAAKSHHVASTGIHPEMKARFIPFIVADSGRLGIKAKEYLDNLFQWNRIPRTYDARTSKTRKTFMSSVGLITERYKARMRSSLKNNIIFI